MGRMLLVQNVSEDPAMGECVLFMELRGDERYRWLESRRLALHQHQSDYAGCQGGWWGWQHPEHWVALGCHLLCMYLAPLRVLCVYCLS